MHYISTNNLGLSQSSPSGDTAHIVHGGVAEKLRMGWEWRLDDKYPAGQGLLGWGGKGPWKGTDHERRQSKIQTVNN